MIGMNSDKANLRRFVLYFVPVVVIIVIASYWRMLDNFFYSDDFEWLDQIRNLEQNPLAIFNPVVHPSTAQLTPLGPNYFSPLVHIIFWVSYKLFGLNPLGYHLFDLALHIINSCLVVYLVYFLVENQALATLTGLFFALNFAITDAVIWSGARVDSVMFTFYILSLIAFLFFLKKERQIYYMFSIFLFILSLSAKGTALSLPFALFLMEKHCKPKTQINQLFKYLPFVFIVLVYIVLLRYNTPENLTLAQTDISRIILNIGKVPMTLFIPEGLVPVNPWMILLYILMFLPVIAFVLKREATGISYLGILFLLVGVLPLIPAAWNFPSNPDPFNMSIRHRLYLGNLGSAMFIGGVVYYFYSTTDKALYKAMSIMLMLTLIGWNIFWNQKIQYQWDEVSNETKSALKEIEDLVSKKPPGSRYYFINFPPRQGFAEKLVKIFFEPYDLRYGIWPLDLPSHINREEIKIRERLARIKSE